VSLENYRQRAAKRALIDSRDSHGAQRTLAREATDERSETRETRKAPTNVGAVYSRPNTKDSQDSHGFTPDQTPRLARLARLANRDSSVSPCQQTSYDKKACVSCESRESRPPRYTRARAGDTYLAGGHSQESQHSHMAFGRCSECRHAIPPRWPADHPAFLGRLGGISPGQPPTACGCRVRPVEPHRDDTALIWCAYYVRRTAPESPAPRRRIA